MIFKHKIKKYYFIFNRLQQCEKYATHVYYCYIITIYNHSSNLILIKLKTKVLLNFIIIAVFWGCTLITQAILEILIHNRQ